MRDLELHALAIRLETNGGEGLLTKAEHREHIIETIGFIRCRFATFYRSTLTCPFEHFRNNNQTELIDSTDFTNHGITRSSILLHRNERRVVMQILHRSDSRQQLGTHIQDTRRRDGLGINHARTRDNRGVLRRTVVVEVNRQAHQITIRHQIRRTHLAVLRGVTGILDDTRRIEQVDLQGIFRHLTRTVEHLTVDVGLQCGIRIEVHRFLGVLIEETKLLESTFQFLTLETHAVDTTTRFREHRELASDRPDVLGRTIQVTRTLDHHRTRHRSHNCRSKGLGGRDQLGLAVGHGPRRCRTRLDRHTCLNRIDRSSGCRSLGFHSEAGGQRTERHNVLRGIDGDTRCVNPLIVDVGIIEQRQVVELLDLLAHVLGHRLHISKLAEELNLLQFDQRLLLVVVRGKLITDGCLSTTSGVVVCLAVKRHNSNPL